MLEIIDKKINELKVELEKQHYSAQDEAEIEKVVQEYKKELVEARKNEYTFNQEIINAKIETLQELRLEEEETATPVSTGILNSAL